MPTVVVEGDLSRTPLTAGVDNVQGGRLATRHLLDLGHNSVVHVAGPSGWSEAVARIDGWRAELHDAGARGAAAALGRGLVGLERVPPPASRWPANRTSPPCSPPTTRWRSACSRRCASRAAGCPTTSASSGFDDLPESEFFDPPLTTVRQDFGELGRRAMALRGAGARRRGERHRRPGADPAGGPRLDRRAARSRLTPTRSRRVSLPELCGSSS